MSKNNRFYVAHRHGLKSTIHTHTQPFNGPLSGTTRVGRHQKKHSPTHTHPDHQTSFIKLLHLQRSTASSMFSLRTWQSFLTTSLQVLFGLGPSTSYSIHFFTESSFSFHNTCPYHRSQECHVDEAGCYTDGTHKMLVGKNVLSCFTEVPKLCHLFLIPLSTHHTETNSTYNTTKLACLTGAQQPTQQAYSTPVQPHINRMQLLVTNRLNKPFNRPLSSQNLVISFLI